MAGFGAAALYLAFPAARFNFDGVACAVSVELGNPRYLVHGNHVAYGVLGWAVYQLMRLCGYVGPALASLQFLSSLLGAAGVAGFCAMLLRFGFAPAATAAASAGLAVSSLYWTWSLEAQVYPFGCAFLVWAAAELAREEPRPVAVGLLHAGAVLGHVGHLMFAAPAWALLGDARARKRYLAVFALATAAAYAAAIVLCVKPRTLDELRVWILGSAALPVDRSFQWHGVHGIYSWQALKDWTRVKLEFVSGSIWAGVLAWGLAGWGWARARRSRPRAARLALFWLLSYPVLYLTWQPHIVVYHYSDVPILWLGLACAVDACPERERRYAAWALGALAVGLAAWNWTQMIGPATDPAANADLQRVLWVSRETPEDSWVVVDQLDQVYIPYFAHRKPMNLRYYPDGPALEARVAAARRAGEPVYAVPQALPPWAGPALQRLGWREVAASSSGKLYLIQ